MPRRHNAPALSWSTATSTATGPTGKPSPAVWKSTGGGRSTWPAMQLWLRRTDKGSAIVVSTEVERPASEVFAYALLVPLIVSLQDRVAAYDPICRCCY
jgi:hypothetical protein